MQTRHPLHVAVQPIRLYCDAAAYSEGIKHLFIREAKKLCQKEFKRWFILTSEVNPLMKYFKDRELPIPTLYLMGEKDYMFIQPVKEMVAAHRKSKLLEIADCGHVCNVERPEEFNHHSISFIQQQIEAPKIG